MKKSRQSLITAALFAAAISTGTAITPQSVSADNDITTVPQTTYGPPFWMMTEPETETPPLETEGTVPIISTSTATTTTTDEFVMLEGDIMVETTTDPFELMTGGIVPAYHEPGDLNRDGSLDARDLSLLKQYLLMQSTGSGYLYETGDVNQDDKYDKEDVKALIRLLTGKPEDEDEPPETTPVTTEELITSMTTIKTTTCPLYGPPPAWE